MSLMSGSFTDFLWKYMLCVLKTTVSSTGKALLNPRKQHLVGWVYHKLIPIKQFIWVIRISSVNGPMLMLQGNDVLLPRI